MKAVLLCVGLTVVAGAMVAPELVAVEGIGVPVGAAGTAEMSWDVCWDRYVLTALDILNRYAACEEAMPWWAPLPIRGICFGEYVVRVNLAFLSLAGCLLGL